jgi:ribosome-binding ATPase YchF (GTP1/OBG family)
VLQQDLQLVEQEVVEQDVVEVQTTLKKSVKRAVCKKLTQKESRNIMSLYGPIISL